MAKIFKGPGPAQEENQEPAEKPHSLPAKVIRSKKMGAGTYPTGPWAEDYKRLQQSIINVLPDVNPRLLLFTSVTDGEESATLVSKFGLVLAAMGEQVLLVDANVREPILHHIFKIDQAPGTTELLSGRLSLTEVMHRFSLNGLNIIPGGTPVKDSFSLQDLGELDSALDVMKAFADWIIFSCPPGQLVQRRCRPCRNGSWRGTRDQGRGNTMGSCPERKIPPGEGRGQHPGGCPQ